jgi:RNA polymerase sigma factor (sigma-70 family)
MRKDELERLYEEHASALFGFLVYRTGDRGLAEDLVADTFVRAFRARRSFDRRRARPKTWLYSIALNLLRDHLRRKDAEQRALERVGAPDPAQTVHGHERVEQRDQVQRALSTLSLEEREAVALRYGAELTVPEIAELTGQPLTTVQGRLSRALKRLRRNLV